MEDTQTPPAGEQEAAFTAPTSISDALSFNSVEAAATTEPEVGATGDDAAIAAPVAVVAPAEAAPAPVTTSAPAAAAGEEAKAPKWYRDHMAAVSRERAAEKAEIERLRAAQPAPTRQPEANQLPDPLEDPQAYAVALQGQFRNEFQAFQLQTTLQLSERFARQQHGSENFEECRAWLSTKPDIEAWAIQQPDPWTAAFTQYQRERLAEEIGDDPAAYKERLRQEFLAEQAAAAQTQQAPVAPTMRAAPPPPSSTVRSAAPRDGTGRFTGPTPLNAVLRG